MSDQTQHQAPDETPTDELTNLPAPSAEGDDAERVKGGFQWGVGRGVTGPTTPTRAAWDLDYDGAS